MTAPSLTPHQDAVRAMQARRRAPACDFEAAVFDMTDLANLIFARWMDEGRGEAAVVRLTASICATLIDTVASSGASSTSNFEEGRVERINVLLGTIMSTLARRQPTHSESQKTGAEEVHSA